MLSRLRTGAAGDSFRTMGWSLVGVGIGFLTGILTARLLGPNDRGVLAVTMSISSLGGLIFGMGTTTAFRALVYRDARASVFAYRRYTAIAGCCLVAAVLAVALVSDISRLDAPNRLIDISTLLLLTLFTFFSMQVLDALNGIGMTSRSAALNAIGSCVTLIVLIVAIVVDGSLFLAILAYALGFVSRVAVGSIWFARNWRSVLPPQGHGSASFLARRGAGFLGLLVGQSLTFRGDQLILAAFSTPREVGLFAVAAAPSSVTMVIAGSVGQVVMRKTAKSVLSARSLLKATGAATGLTLLVGASIALVAPFLVPTLYGVEFSASVPAMQVFLFAQVLLAPYMVASRAVAGYGKSGRTTIVGVVGVAVLVSSLAVLAPSYGAFGAAVGAAVAYCVMSVLAYWFANGLVRDDGVAI